jgi:hypothetical protein
MMTKLSIKFGIADPRAPFYFHIERIPGCAPPGNVTSPPADPPAELGPTPPTS